MSLQQKRGYQDDRVSQRNNLYWLIFQNIDFWIFAKWFFRVFFKFFPQNPKNSGQKKVSFLISPQHE